MKHFKNMIDGKECDALSSRTFQNINPANREEILGFFPDSDAHDIEQAVASARRAYFKWRSVPPPKRAEILYRAAQLLAERKSELAKVITREVGKSYESSLGDVQSGIDMANYIAGEGRRMFGATTQSSLPKRFAMTKRYPVGVVGVITSWNFPMAITCWKVLPALVAGNTVVLKSEENSPETGFHFGQILMEAGLPTGVLNVVHGKGTAAGKALVEHPRVDMVSFTGSSVTGREIGKTLAARHAKISLELGGKNAVLVMEDADIDLTVNSIICGAFSVSGQRCSATARAIIHKDVYDKIVGRLVDETKKLKIGNGFDATNVVTPIVSEKQYHRVLGYLAEVQKNHIKILTGGNPVTTGDCALGYYIEPTIVEVTDFQAPIWRDEVFGPVLAIAQANSFEEALALHNDCDYGLSASLFTRDINKAFVYFDEVEAGACYINGPTFGSEVHMPFGGYKKSGRGYREAGQAILEACTEIKSLYIDYSAQLQNAQFEDKKKS